MKVTRIRQIDETATLSQLQKLADATPRREFGVQSVEGRFYLFETKDGKLPGRFDDDKQTAKLGDEVYIATPRGPIHGQLTLIDRPLGDAFARRRTTTVASAVVGGLAGGAASALLFKGSQYGWVGMAVGATAAAGLLAAGASLAHTEKNQQIFTTAKQAQQQLAKLTVALVE